ncbi:hypothetical protein AAES_30690 [Amazona aestiva]|uniref:Uncharacterized protein n=1 Tax=Amazona aestiva TaxID=12930 RepID=A0A0Q3RZ09_AMAAE|nr:hypothetical protein AAES_30690 [Amazona aestiva]
MEALPAERSCLQDWRAGHLPEASQYLSQAEWIILRTPACSAAVQHRLHRSLGLFCAAKGDFEKALYHLANDARELGLKASELLKQLPQQESPEPLGHLLTLMNVEPSSTK